MHYVITHLQILTFSHFDLNIIITPTTIPKTYFLPLHINPCHLTEINAFSFDCRMINYNNECFIINRMEKRTFIELTHTQSHDLLHDLYKTFNPNNSNGGVGSEKENDRYRLFNQRLHNTSKISTVKQMGTLSKGFLKDSQLLKKQNNKIQANIKLHSINKNAHISPIQTHIHKPSFANSYSSLNQSFFTPKTRQEILFRNRNSADKSPLSHKTNKHLSNISIKSINHSPSINNDNSKLKSRFSSLHSSPIDSVNTIDALEPHYVKSKKWIFKQNSLLEIDNFFLQKQSRKSQTLVKKLNRFRNKQSQQQIKNDQISTKATQISGFTRHQLFGYYKSLISFSKDSLNKYMAGFQTMLNLMNIATNQNTVKQLLSNYFNKPSFNSFMDVFEQIIECSLKESVVDYFEIVLDGKWSRQLCYDELTHLLSQRMTSYHAKEIVQQIYYNLKKTAANKIEVREIVQLCYENQQFCRFMRGYCQQTKRINKKIKLPF